MRKHCLYKHSLLLYLKSGRVSNTAGVKLRFAAVPQVDDGLVDVEQDHGGSRAKAAAVTSHLQQVALHRHFTTHTVKTPLTWLEQVSVSDRKFLSLSAIQHKSYYNNNNLFSLFNTNIK